MTTTGLMPRRCDAEEKNISGRIFSLLSKSKKNGHCPLLTGERGRQGQRRGNASGRRGKFPLFLGLALLFSESRSRSPFFLLPASVEKPSPAEFHRQKRIMSCQNSRSKKETLFPLFREESFFFTSSFLFCKKRECSKTRDC